MFINESTVDISTLNTPIKPSPSSPVLRPFCSRKNKTLVSSISELMENAKMPKMMQKA
jgi:hypothetical protein